METPPQTKWSVNTKDGTVDFNSSTLLDVLLGRVMQTPKADFDELIINFGRFLQSRNLFGDMKFNQLIGMSFAVGYYYRVFLEKNDVQITMTDDSNMEPTPEENEDITAEENDGEMVSKFDSESDSEESSSSVS